MKYPLLIILFAAIFCSNLKRVEDNNKLDPIEIIKCLLDKGIPVVQEVLDMIEAIKAKDIKAILDIIGKFYETGKTVYLECFYTEIFNLGIDWKKFGQCILQKGGEAIPELADLVHAIVNSDWFRVGTIALKLLIKGIPIVVECVNSS